MFTRMEAETIINLIRKKLVASPNEQKRIRDKIRALGFYASDFGIGGGYTEHDFMRVVRIIGGSSVSKIVKDIEQPKYQPGGFSEVRNRKFTFPPISKPDAILLILGTMPGERSLSLNQYYGHGGNQFWKIMFSCFGQPFTQEYNTKIALLTQNKIALWDVLQYCEREGSSDNTIAEEYPNDFNSFFADHPHIRSVIFNGSNASDYFHKYIGFTKEYQYFTLPSTSPANTWSTKEEKVKVWCNAVQGCLK